MLADGAVANDAEQRKRAKYFSLAARYYFVPVAIETLGLLSDEALQFLRDVGRRVAAETETAVAAVPAAACQCCHTARQCCLCH